MRAVAAAAGRHRLLPPAPACRGRIVLVDGRFSFIHTRFAGGGGNASNRSSERHEREIAYLRHKWGRWLDVVHAKGTTRLVVRVQR